MGVTKNQTLNNNNITTLSSEIRTFPYARINSEWFKDQNVRPEIIKLLKENIGRTLFDTNYNDIILYHSPKIKEIKAKIKIKKEIKAKKPNGT